MKSRTDGEFSQVWKMETEYFVDGCVYDFFLNILLVINCKVTYVISFSVAALVLFDILPLCKYKKFYPKSTIVVEKWIRLRLTLENIKKFKI